MQVLGAYRQYYLDRLAARSSDEEGDEIACCLIGPMQILDDEQESMLLRQTRQELEQDREESSPIRCLAANLGTGRGRRQLWPKPPQLDTVLRGQPAEHALPQLRAQRRNDRRVRKLAFRQLQALPDQYELAALARSPLQLRHEPALANPSLTDDHRSIPPRVQERKILISADEPLAGHRPDHAEIITDSLAGYAL